MDKKHDQPNTETVPDDIRGWSWGAFGLNGIWGLGNRTYSALFAFIPLINIVMIIILGLNGRRWAWKNRDWESTEHFERVQRKWDLAGKITFGVYIAAFLYGIIGIIS